jgi:hypothetical protein
MNNNRSVKKISVINKLLDAAAKNKPVLFEVPRIPYNALKA